MVTRRTRWLGLILLALLAAIGGALYWSVSSPVSRAPRTSSDASSPLSVPAAERETASTPEPSARESAPSLDQPRAFRAELVRYPDEQVLAYVPVEIEPRESLLDRDVWLATDERGTLVFDLAAGASTFTLRASGFEPAEVRLRADTLSTRVELTPSSGLFGRVVDANGRAVPGAEVRLETTSLVVQYMSRLTSVGARTQVHALNSVTATTRANEGGLYYLSCATRTRFDRVTVSSASATGAFARCEVELPREPIALPDLVVTNQNVLVFHVVDESGAPIADSYVGSGDNPRPREQQRTHDDGLVAYAAPKLPASFAASARGWRTRELRFDGSPVKFGTPVTSCDTRVEFVLAKVPSLRVRVLDRETKYPVFLGSGFAELSRDDLRVGRSSFQLDTNGEALVTFADDQRDSRDIEVAGAAQLFVWARGYARTRLDIDLSEPPSEPLVILLEPETSTSLLLRGRVVRAGEPVASLQIGLGVQRRSEGAKPRDWQYTRVWSDSGGHFAARWNRKADDDAITVFPHVFTWDEFGFIGPLSSDEAITGEHVLELKPAARVPVILRGVSREGRYCYYVHLVDGDLVVSTTINGAPISVNGDGEARTMLQLPSDRRSRVTVGYTHANYVVQNGSEPVDFDPANPHGPLVFELKPFFANVSGRAVGFADVELPRLSVAFAGGHDEESRAVRVSADGTFHITGVPRAEGSLFLFLDDESGPNATTLARIPLNVQGDVVGVQLLSNPGLLPENPSQRR